MGVFEQKEAKIAKRIRKSFAAFASFCSISSVHPLYAKAHALSREVIGAAIEVHRLKGAGLIESIYEKCLLRELELRSIRTINQQRVEIEYKGFIFEETLRFDLLIEDCLLIELKSVQEVLPIHKAQLFSYMKLLNVPMGLLLNFHAPKLIAGVHRMMLPGSGPEN